jgi:phenylacetate-coenzyme A ligase PaaK-like adenylate-forming protein
LWLQNAARIGFGYYITNIRYYAAFVYAHRDRQARDEGAADRVQRYLDDTVRSLVHHAATTVPYYRARFKRDRITPEDVMTGAGPALLPIF